MKKNNIDENTNKRKKEICYYCVFREENHTFQQQIEAVFKEYLDNIKSSREIAI